MTDRIRFGWHKLELLSTGLWRRPVHCVALDARVCRTLNRWRFSRPSLVGLASVQLCKTSAEPRRKRIWNFAKRKALPAQLR